MDRTNLILWASTAREPIVARVAICGDFLPAGKLVMGCDESWSDKARGLQEYFADAATTFQTWKLRSTATRLRRVC